MKPLIIRKAAVLGAGVMGTQIAAHLINADVPVVLFDLSAKEGASNGVVIKALDGLKKLSPAPLTQKSRLDHIIAANYDEHLAKLADCDLVIEAIAEKMAWKEDLYQKIGPHLKAGCIIASNTSGLSIQHLSGFLPMLHRPNFCGIHFFNPPRYMSLVEIIPAKESQALVLDQLETWLTSRLGKNVVRAKDTPNFIANRVGIFSLLATLYHAERLKLSPDFVDILTGPKIGRSKSATFRTLDVVGLDTFNHVVSTMRETLPNDPWHLHFNTPGWLRELIEQGALGQKTKAGIFKKVGQDIQVFSPQQNAYCAIDASKNKIAPEVAEILNLRDLSERFVALSQCMHPQADFLWSCFRDVFHYCAYHLAEIADCARDVDFAMRWGFGWTHGPFEIWQAAGWDFIARAIEADIAAGKTLTQMPLPKWVRERSSGQHNGVHTVAGSWSAAASCLRPRSALPVYQRQIFPETVFGEIAADITSCGKTVWQNDAVRLWTHALDERIAILTITAKNHALGVAVLSGTIEAVRRAEDGFDGLVLWQEAPFAVGANLKEMMAWCEKQDFQALENMVRQFQAATMALKYAQVPTVAAVQGLALGGGCEFAMHAAHRVLALESHMGLVEAGVGLIPAGGGCKEFVLAAAQNALGSSGVGADPFPRIQSAFQSIAHAKVSGSAHEAVDLGLAKASDDVVFHPREILYIALQRARSLAIAGYRPPLKAVKVSVAGRAGIATLEATLLNLRDGEFISAHDYKVGRSAAVALCGGEVDTGSQVSEEWILAVERQEFIALLKTPETQARIAHMVEKGKALRN